MDIHRFDVADKGCRALVYQGTAYLSGVVALDFDAAIDEQVKQIIFRVFSVTRKEWAIRLPTMYTIFPPDSAIQIGLSR